MTHIISYFRFYISYKLSQQQSREKMNSNIPESYVLDRSLFLIALVTFTIFGEMGSFLITENHSFFLSVVSVLMGLS